MNEEEKKAIEYYQNQEVSFSVDFDTENLLKALGITEEDSFENHQIRFKTLLNLIEKLQKENEKLKEERQIVGMPVRNKRDGRIGIVLHQWESGSVAVLESINPRVINTHDSWNTLEIVTDEVKDGNDTNVGSI